MLFTPHRLGALTLPNRIVMPPMTRSRAADGNVATADMAAYYAQRASAGLIVSEGTQISPQGQGYAWTPGIHSPDQVKGWRRVTDAVHAAGTHLRPAVACGPGLARGPAAGWCRPGVVVGVVGGRREGVRRPDRGRSRSRGGRNDPAFDAARCAKTIPGIVADYAQAARNALDAGFDGVELHGANGYLINQFIDSQANRRTGRLWRRVAEPAAFPARGRAGGDGRSRW